MESKYGSIHSSSHHQRVSSYNHARADFTPYNEPPLSIEQWIGFRKNKSMPLPGIKPDSFVFEATFWSLYRLRLYSLRQTAYKDIDKCTTKNNIRYLQQRMIIVVLKCLRRKSWNVTLEVKCKLYVDVHNELR